MTEDQNGILICTGIFSPDVGGPASYTRTLATRLAASRSVTVLTYSSVWRSPGDASVSFRVIRVWSRWPKGLKHLLYFVKALSVARNYDIVLALNAVSAGIPARLVARLFKRTFAVKIVGDVAWERAVNNRTTSLLLDDFQKSRKTGLIGLLHRLQFQVCKGAHAIIVPSKYLSRIIEGWGIPREKIHVIYNGTDFTPSSFSKEQARKKLGLTGNIIFTWGRLVPWKGFRMLIKIMPKLAGINQFFTLVILGSGPDLKNLRAMVRNLGLDRKIVFTSGSVREVADHLAAADLVVLNTGYEGFSHQVLEAMTAGVALVTTNAGGNVEIVEQGRNGLMVKYNDEFNLIEAIRALWENPELREQLVVEGRKTAAKFSVEKMFNETVDLLASL